MFEIADTAARAKNTIRNHFNLPDNDRDPATMS
jgi:hypothetical protein